VHLVDLEAVFQEVAPNGLPGFDLFLDYVHPTRAGNLLVSRAVFDAIAGGALLGPPSTRRFRPGAPPPRGPDPDLRLRGRLLWFFLAMHQYETIVDVTTALLVTDLPDAERRRLEDLRGHALAFLDSRRRELLGEPYDDTYRERHAAFMREAFQDVYDPARATDESLDH
jgi:hypothetical protein